MAETIRTLFRRIWPHQNETKAFIGGLDYSGKTTLLYKILLGEVVQATPTIGFNVETIHPLSSSGKRKLSLTCWDAGGCDKIRPLYRYYLTGIAALIWMVDCSDPTRLQESRELLETLLPGYSPEDSGVDPGVPILILANKRESANAISVKEIFSEFSACCKGRLCHVVPTSLVAPMKESGLPEAFDWLESAMHISRSMTSGQTIPTMTAAETQDQNKEALDPSSKEGIQKKLGSYLDRAVSDSPPDEFLKQFENLELPAWDHYTHIRLAYIILVKFGRQKGKDMIFDGIQRYIAESKQTTGRTFHITMTYFWIQIVHFGIRSMPSFISPVQASSKMSLGSVRSTSTVSVIALDIGRNSPNTIFQHPATKDLERDDFCRFLLLNPYVADGGLWADYYSKGVMMSPKAKEGMVLPDKKALPNLVVRDSLLARGE